MKRRLLTVLAMFFLAGVVLLPANLRAAEIDLADLGTACLATDLDDCKVLTAGYLNVAEYGENDGAPLFAWQTQTGTSENDGNIGGFVLFQHGDAGWSVLGSGFDGFFEIPELSEGLIHVPGYSQGTGAFNTDRLYQQGDAGWTAIEMDNWLGDIGTKLPAGLQIWKGVDYDFSQPWNALVARTPLWREDDGNCCATGGSAVITLEIDDGHLVATAVDYTAPVKPK